MASPSDPTLRPDLLDVLDQVRQRPPTLGGGRLLCIDGLAGSGKTTLARTLVRLAPEAEVLGTDDMLEGWRGLPGLPARVDALLRPLAEGEPGTWRRWDWYASRWAETHTVRPGPLLVLEGVGSAAAVYDDLITVRVWVEADHDVRAARALARDGDATAPHWETWLADEAAHHARDRTRERADIVIDTTSLPLGASGPRGTTERRQD